MTQAFFIVLDLALQNFLSKNTLWPDRPRRIFYRGLSGEGCVLVDLLQLPTVLIDKSDGYKFIVAIVDLNGQSKMVVRANADCEYHRDILQQLRFEMPGIRARCIGGGRININPVNKTIKIWSSSGDFGVEPDRTETLRLLREAFPDFNIQQGSY